MLTITETDFQRLVRFVKQNYGIDLSKKKQLILGRLSNTILSMGFLKTTRNLLMRFRSSLNRDRLPSGHLPPRSPKNWHPTFGSRFRTPD